MDYSKIDLIKPISSVPVISTRAMSTPQTKMTTTKRRMYQPVQVDSRSDDEKTLSTLGMRVRKAVAEGYKVDTNPYQGYNQGNTFTYNKLSNHVNYQEPNPQLHPSTRRMPLPHHIENVPALTNAYSTFESNASEWDSHHVSQYTMSPQKRKPTDHLSQEPEIHRQELKFCEDF